MRIILALFILEMMGSCRNAIDTGNIEVLYRDKKYTYISEHIYDLKSKLDTALYFSSLCNSGKFDEATDIFNDPEKYQVLGGWVFDTKIVDTLSSIHAFPYGEYDSYELLMLANYYDQRYNANKDFIDRLLRESIKRDSANIYSLYFLAKLGILSQEYTKTCFLINSILEEDSSWESVRKMKKFIGQECESGVSSFQQIINVPVYVYGVDFSNYDRF